VQSKESIFKIHLGSKLGRMRLDELSDEDVQQLKASLQERGAKTVNNVLSVLEMVAPASRQHGRGMGVTRVLKVSAARST